MFLQYICLGLENHKVGETHLNEQNFSKIKFSSSDDKLALGSSAAVFIGLVVFFSSDKC